VRHRLRKDEWLAEEIQLPPNRTALSIEDYWSKHVDKEFVKTRTGRAYVPDLKSNSDVNYHRMPDESLILLPELMELVKRFDAREMTCKVRCMGHGGSALALLGLKLCSRLTGRQGPPDTKPDTCLETDI